MSRLLALMGLALTITAAPARADETSAAEAVALLAKDIKDAISGREQKILIGALVPHEKAGAARLANCAPELLRLLRAELQKLGVADDLSADFNLSGTFCDTEPRLAADRQAFAPQMVTLDFRLYDRFKDKGTEFSRRITTLTDVVRLLGLTVEVKAKASADEQRAALKVEVDKHIRGSEVKPKPEFDGSKVRAASGSPFAVELLSAEPKADPKAGHDPDDYSSVKPQAKAGLAFAPIDHGHVYAVRLHNSAAFDAAVSLTIDGLSMFVAADKEFFEKGQLKVNFVIVPAGGSVTVRGWFVNLRQTDEFKVTAYADSLANTLKSSGTVGVVNARFHAAVKPGQPFPDGEPLDAGAFSQSADGTGRGARVASPYEKVERRIGLLRANVAVRYSKN